MNSKNRILLAVFLVVSVTVTTLILRARAQAPPAPTPSLPAFVPYMFLFDHHNFNLKQARALEAQRQDDSEFRFIFMRDAALTDDESATLDQVTNDCEQQLAIQDAQAQAVIDGFRAQYPAGKLPDGVTLPPPPEELATMQQQRNAVILSARDRLHVAFGDQEFARLDSWVQSHIAATVTASHNGVNSPGVPK